MRAPREQMTWEKLDAIVEAGTWFRGSHLALCHVCGKEIGRHTRMIHPEGFCLWYKLCAPNEAGIQYVKP